MCAGSTAVLTSSTSQPTLPRSYIHIWIDKLILASVQGVTGIRSRYKRHSNVCERIWRWLADIIMLSWLRWVMMEMSWSSASSERMHSNSWIGCMQSVQRIESSSWVLAANGCGTKQFILKPLLSFVKFTLRRVLPSGGKNISWSLDQFSCHSLDSQDLSCYCTSELKAKISLFFYFRMFQ